MNVIYLFVYFNLMCFNELLHSSDGNKHSCIMTTGVVCNISIITY